jgi:hypothetical protein
MRYTGKVARVDIQHRAPKSRTVTIEVAQDRLPPVGATVELRVELTDEEIGKRLRSMLTKPEIIGLAIEDLAREVDETAGWPILADLIRDVGL